MDQSLEELKAFLPYFVGSAVLARGFLDDEGIREEYRRTVENLRKETEDTLKTVKEQADQAIADAKKLAEEIEARARRTAQKISVKDAQDQFKEAEKDLTSAERMWAGLALVAVGVLIAVPFAFMQWPLPPNSSWPVALYHTLLRLLVLSAAAGGTAFAFRMLRAYSHMRQLNKHRMRLANSIEGFVNSAQTPEQRDLILSSLVEAVSDFGASGLIHRDDDGGSPQVLSSEAIGRILGAIAKK